jgi:carbamate kinase
VEIVERREIRNLVESGYVVIACGGGGIPVARTQSGLRGAEGVIDKDLAAERLAHSVGARTLLIITDVPMVYSNYGTRIEKGLDKLTIKEAEVYMMGGQFPMGSMGPKVEAAIRFIRHGGRRVIITDKDSALEALRGKAGTIITR